MLTKEQVKQMAAKAALDLSEKQAEALRGPLSQKEALAQAMPYAPDGVATPAFCCLSALRGDEVWPSLPLGQALRNAKNTREGWIALGGLAREVSE